MAQISVFSPWKDASVMRGGEDQSVLLYAKCIADAGQGGGQVTNATITVAAAADTITFQTAEALGALANDAGITYTAPTGAAGTITTADGNIGNVGAVINTINGVGVGQVQITRWRAALADYPPAIALVANDMLVRGATPALLGRNSIGLPLFSDTSTAGAIAADDLWIGIGTNGGCREGSGWMYPDYFEDIPGTSTTGSVNTPVRAGVVGSRKFEDTVTRRKQYRITGFSSQSFLATTVNLQVRDIWNNILWNEPLVAGAVVPFQDRSDVPITGPVGSPLFCRFWGTGANTDGSITVQAEERVC